MAEAKKQYGLLIERDQQHGTDYIKVWVTSRKDDKPYGCSSDGERSWEPEIPKHVHGLQLDGLCMHGFVSELNDGEPYIGYEPEYRSVYSIDAAKAKRMIKTLNKVSKQLAKDEAHEPTEVFEALARALKLDFVVERAGVLRGGYSPNPSEFRFMTVPAGRNRFRQMIEEAQADARKRKGKAA